MTVLAERVVGRGLDTGFLSPDETWRVSELKKLKLIAKDRMEAIIRHARTETHA